MGELLLAYDGWQNRDRKGDTHCGGFVPRQLGLMTMSIWPASR